MLHPRRLAAALLVAVLVVATAPPAVALNVGLNVLVLTTPGKPVPPKGREHPEIRPRTGGRAILGPGARRRFSNVDFFIDVVRGYGVPYTVVRWDAAASPRQNLTQLLWAPDGSARFGAYLMYPNLEAMGAMNRAEVEELWAFQHATAARSVKFAAWPTNVGYLPDVSACTSDDVPMRFTAAAPLGISGIKSSAVLGSEGMCPAIKASPLPACSMWAADFAGTGLHPGCTSTPVLDFDGGVYTAGVLVNYADGRESLAFTFDCASWTPSCLLLGHFSLTWMLRNILPGERQALLSPQMDDFFLSTKFDAGQYVGGRSQYRATVPDLRAHITAWRTDLLARLPAGSDIRLELPLSGNGVLDAAARNGAINQSLILNISDRSCLDLPDYVALGCDCWFIGTDACPATAPLFCRQCTKDWKKPVGTGANRAPAGALTSPSTWNVTAFLSGDALAAEVAGNADTRSGFFYSHHTWSHQNLDNATLYDAQVQIQLNKRIAAADYLNIAALPTFSSRCMVTPQISGLRNGDALAALAEAGVTCATGDNTWPFLLNQDNPYHPLYTTVATNGYDGFAIIPRFATEVYYNCSTETQNADLYNRLYSNYYGPSTINDILAREAARVVRDSLLKLRHDPFMFHQANLAILDASGKSLVMRWVDAVVDLYSTLVAWPLRSLGLDDLFAQYKAREARDACALSYTLEVAADGGVGAVSVSSGSGGSCSAPLMTGAGTSSIAVSGGAGRFVTSLVWGKLGGA
ncbi:hypothetical protein Rsub_10589 [Raphidocelis subcapitata]|uniref:Agd3 deacetylase domain-containing protein n=1 Tax=Raphidocelis subcapitata TaxID=307507 RepID=A0A2V0PDJ9_9CHLO|nr:hypothetical protein Rsub_10589 [Raphidocelis subcapitata]|eukprot:GBF97916.1 hypothetical protein Rsub_10589 [Raphidocelis subcapitata]